MLPLPHIANGKHPGSAHLAYRCIDQTPAMAPKSKQPHGPPMTLGNMRELGVQHLMAFCHNNGCRHQARIDVSKCPDETEVPSFGKCAIHRVGENCADMELPS